jgi:hypothetical protein
MIQQLLTYLNDDWRALTAGQSPTPELTLTLGALELNQRALDRSGRVQPQPIQQRLPLRLPTVTAYALAQTPLEGSLDAEAIFDPDTVSERRQMLFPGDFTILAATPTAAAGTILAATPTAAAGTILAATPTAAAGAAAAGTTLAATPRPEGVLQLTPAGVARCRDAAQLAVNYRYPGVLATQEFTQRFEAAIGAPTWQLVEQWAALFLALVVTDAETLVARSNQATAVTPYSAGGFNAGQSLEQLTLLAGTPDTAGSAPLLRLHGQVRGRLALSKAAPDAFGLIEQVRSPGMAQGDANGQAVAVEIGVAFGAKQP